MRMQRISPVLLLLMVLSVVGCGGLYYDAMEKIGVHKREILVDRVIEARDSQQQTKEQFASALEHFSRVINFEGGDLEDKYIELRDELEQSRKQAEAVRERIDAVVSVANALFEEWEDELGQYHSASLRQKSEKQLKQTRRHYQKLIGAMRRAETKIDPVLNPLSDQVLFLKHNLNARAVASLEGELTRIETDVALLIRDMEQAMSEADSFIKALRAD